VKAVTKTSWFTIHSDGNTLTFVFIIQNKHNMKKSLTYMMIAMVALTALPLQSTAAKNETISKPSTANDPGKAISNSLNNRIEEINKMDISSMSTAEKKELRKEVQGIQKMIKQSGGGVYISVGAIIIILLLLIILL
jgi:hypothetical protein